MSDEVQDGYRLRRALIAAMGRWTDEIRDGHGSRRDGLIKAREDVNEIFERFAEEDEAVATKRSGLAARTEGQRPNPLGSMRI